MIVSVSYGCKTIKINIDQHCLQSKLQVCFVFPIGASEQIYGQLWLLKEPVCYYKENKLFWGPHAKGETHSS